VPPAALDRKATPDSKALIDEREEGGIYCILLNLFVQILMRPFPVFQVSRMGHKQPGWRKCLHGR